MAYAKAMTQKTKPVIKKNNPGSVLKEKQKIDENGKPVFNAHGDPVTENVEVKMMGFKAASTFDISQTEGEPVPTLAVEELTGRVDEYDTLMEAIKQAVEIPIAFEDIQSGAKGYYSVTENRIAIKEGIYDAEHEHIKAHNVISEFRSGLCVSEEEIDRLNAIITPLINNGHSVHQIYIEHENELMCSEKTIFLLLLH